MALEYIGLKQINGPLVVLDGVHGASYEEMVKIKAADGSERQGRIIEIHGDLAVVQVFEGTDGLSLTNTTTQMTGKPMTMPLTKELLGRVLSGSGRPIDGLGEIYPDEMGDVNGMAMNPVLREYPENFIQTGISAIDGLSTLIRGQKLPIFSGNGCRTIS